MYKKYEFGGVDGFGYVYDYTAESGETIEIMVFTGKPGITGETKDLIPIGVIHLYDEQDDSYFEDTLLAVLASDSRWGHLRSITELSEDALSNLGTGLLVSKNNHNPRLNKGQCFPLEEK